MEWRDVPLHTDLSQILEILMLNRKLQECDSVLKKPGSTRRNTDAFNKREKRVDYQEY